jgi:hypothetical protein
MLAAMGSSGDWPCGGKAGLQAARLELRNKRAIGATWQFVDVDELDLAIAGRNPRQQLTKLLGKGWVEVGQFCRQLITLIPIAAAASASPPHCRQARQCGILLVHGAGGVGRPAAALDRNSSDSFSTR